MPRPDYLDKSFVLRNANERKMLNDLIAALKPGLYVKCSRCKRFGQGETVHFNSTEVFCEECA